MTHLYLGFEDFVNIVRNIDKSIGVSKFIHSLFYYETDDIYYLYKPFDTLIYCTEIRKAKIEKIENFKIDYLANAIKCTKPVK